MVDYNARSPSLAFIALVALSAAGCDDPRAPLAPDAILEASPDVEARSAFNEDAAQGHKMAALRRATAPFHRIAAAAEAGYTVLVTHPTTGATCFEDPSEGGMGRHYVNPDLLDGELSVVSPEALIYEPTKDGRLRLVSVEYLVPFAVRGPEKVPPSLFGHNFHPNSTFGLWTLHVHVWKHNPSGTFADWNPNVSCRYNDAVD